MPRIVSGFEVGRFVPESVLRDNGLDARATVDQLVAAAAAHDAGNLGYLSKAELQQGADDLLVSLGTPTTPTTPTGDAFDYAPSVLVDIKDQFLRSVPGRSFTDSEVIGAAALWDDGNGYLKKKELEAGARELQMTAASGQPLRAADIASIRSWTGCTRQGAPPAPPPPSGAAEIGVVSDIDKTLMPPERSGVEQPAYPGVAALLTLLERGPQGNGALGDVTYVTARNPGRVTNMDAWLASNQLPAGIIETGTVAFPLQVAEDEKVRDIERLFQAHPTQRFVLFGDTNHRDPDVYRRIRSAFPTQVIAVIMHDVKTIDAARLVGHDLVNNYAEAAAVLFKARVLDETGARAVMNAARTEGLTITAAAIDALIDSHRP